MVTQITHRQPNIIIGKSSTHSSVHHRQLTTQQEKTNKHGTCCQPKTRPSRYSQHSRYMKRQCNTNRQRECHHLKPRQLQDLIITYNNKRECTIGTSQNNKEVFVTHGGDKNCPLSLHHLTSIINHGSIRQPRHNNTRVTMNNQQHAYGNSGAG
jgi:hypothetical protein